MKITKIYSIEIIIDSMGSTFVKCSANHPKVDCSRSATAAGTRRDTNHRNKVFKQESLELSFLKKITENIFHWNNIEQ
jgi:hypothetical protein